MAILEAAAEPMTPGAVQQALDRPLAYTTVMTTLVRLHAKGVLTRRRMGRAFVYSPSNRADDRAAQSMTEALAHSANPADVLSRFVDALSEQDEALLRRILEAGGRDT